MLVTLSMKEMTVRPAPPSNALSPMLVTLLGMVTEVRPEHPRNLQLIVFQLILFQTIEK
jgi:hypothetical protein